jgi:putative membrane protein
MRVLPVLLLTAALAIPVVAHFASAQPGSPNSGTGAASPTAADQTGAKEAQSAQVPAAPAPGMTNTPATRPAPMANLNPQDQKFFQAVAMGGMAEVETGKLAQQKASNADVKDFGRRMAEDHGKANAKLTQWAQSKNVPMPAALDDAHQKKQAQLQALSGVAFDRAYIAGQIDDHQKTAKLMEDQIKSGRDAKLKAIASETLPVVRHHLQIVQGLSSQVQTGQAKPKK